MPSFLFFTHSNEELVGEILQKTNKLKKGKCLISHYKDGEILVHIDAYRISKPKEIIDLGWKDLIKNPQNIIIIEWADKIKKILSRKYIRVDFRHKNKNKRWIKIKKF